MWDNEILSKPMMNVVIVVHVGLPHVGGSEIFCDELGKAFAKLGHKVTILTTDWTGAVGEPERNIKYVYLHNPSVQYGSFLFDINPDLVIVFGSNVWPATEYKAEWGFNMVWIPCWIADKPLHPHMAACSKAIVGIHHGEKYASCFACPGVPSFPHPGQVYGINGDFLFAPTGTWPHKQVDRLISMIGKYPLVITGSGPKLFAVPENVTYLGQAPRSVVAWLFGRCKAVVSASCNEMYGLIFREARYFGKPCVCYDVGAAVELGCLVAPVNDEQFWKRQLAKALESPYIVPWDSGNEWEQMAKLILSKV